MILAHSCRVSVHGHCFWAMVKQNIMEEGSGRGKLQSGSREGQEGAENQGMPPVSYIL